MYPCSLALRPAPDGAPHQIPASARPRAPAVSLTPPVRKAPFLALRSMYVAEDDADTAELHVTGAHGRTLPPVGFGQVQATAFRFGRSVVSRHNTSAPDLTFETFER